MSRALAAYPTRRSQPGRAEQDPAGWLEAARSVVGRLTSDAPGARWAGIGLAGMIPTLVTVDAAGNPTGPAITWEDSRAEEEGRRLRAKVGEASLYAATGQRVDGRYLLPMLAWLGEHEPARVAAARTVLGAKDYLFWWLTGRYATDPSTATGFGCYDLEAGAWSPELWRAAGVREPGMLPDVLDSSTVLPLDSAAAAVLGLKAGTPVILGGADSALGLLGMGATDPGNVACMWGSSCVILGVSTQPVLEPRHRYLVTPLAGIPGWGLEMDLLSAGSAVGWLAVNLNLGGRARREPADELLALAAAAPIGAHGASFLPFLAVGEQGARWDPVLRGTVLGLSLAHGPADLARALVEGIVLEIRRCLLVLDEAGLPPAPIAVAGASSSAPFLSRLLADSTGRDTRWSRGEPAYSAIGAALLAAAVTGVHVRPTWHTELTTPDAAATPAWATLAARNESLVRWAHELYDTSTG